jgi:hypothetical protein
MMTFVHVMTANIILFVIPPRWQVFHAGPSKQMHWITTAGSGSLVASISRGDDTDAMNGNAVMYDIGKLLTIGGAPNYDAGVASQRAYMVDINGSEATVQRTANDLQFPRALLNAVVLPNGEVIVIGGQTSVKLFSDDNAVLEAEIWNPSTGRFTTLSRMYEPRNYHSVALLMKDGRVWVAGMLFACKNGGKWRGKNKWEAQNQKLFCFHHRLFGQGAAFVNAVPIMRIMKFSRHRTCSTPTARPWPRDRRSSRCQRRRRVPAVVLP